MRFAFWVLLVFIAWFFLGALIASSDAYYGAFKDMSNYLLLDWFLNISSDNLLILFWFIGLCIIGGLLAISFMFCSYFNLLKVAKKQRSRNSILLLFIHVMFVIIMGLHLASMVFGYKHSNVKMSVNDEFVFEDGFSVVFDSVKYIDDLSVLKLEYKEMRAFQTQELFHYKENIAFVTLYQHGEKISSGELTILSPFAYGSLRVTIDHFFIPPDAVSDVPKIEVVVMKNALVELFFISYLLFIFCVLWFLIISWKRSRA